MFGSVCVCVRLCVCLRGSTETSIVAHCLIFPQLSRFETFGRNMTGYRYFEKVKETLSTGLAASHRDPQYNFSCSWSPNCKKPHCPHDLPRLWQNNFSCLRLHQRDKIISFDQGEPSIILSNV